MTYDADNQLRTVNGTNVMNDYDGNLTNGPLAIGNWPSPVPSFTNYTYDARNRLLNAGGVFNTYDALNNRIGQTVGTNTTTYVVNPNAALPQVLMRIKNGVTNYYIYGAGLLYQVTETATATNTLTYHYDYRGSTVALSGDNGLVTDRIEYSLYGLTTYRAGTNDTPFLFNGRYGVQTDPNGLLYMRARYYNPYLCRFINPDPSGFAGGLNFDAYANGNPVSYLDPFGLDAQSTGDSDNSSLYISVSNQIPGQPCITCHGVSYQGYYGGVNSFYGLPGSGPDALKGYSEVEEMAINATPIILSPLMGFESGIATVTEDGILQGANYAQRTFNSTFSSGGTFAGQTVEDIAAALRSGTLSPSDVPIQYIVKDANTLILNTRSAQALEQAGIPRGQWNAIDMTGDAAAQVRLAAQLQRNGLTSQGIPTVTPNAH
jgi:RHS repeat-associated protein